MPRGPSVAVLSRPREPKHHLGILEPGGSRAGTLGGRGDPCGDSAARPRSPAGSKCKCSRKGPKIRYSDVKKLEMKPKYPHCEEKMVM